MVLGTHLYEFLLSNLFSIIIFSILPHKEWRFIMCSIPIFNLFSAISLNTISFSKSETRFFSNRLLCKSIVYLTLFSQLFVSVFMVLVSFYNYPGGYALTYLHSLECSEKNVLVHIDTYSAISGVTRFGQHRRDWNYSKSENLSLNEYQSFTHLLTNQPKVHNNDFKTIAIVYGYSGLNLKHAYAEIKKAIRSRSIKCFIYSNFKNNRNSTIIFGVIKLEPKVWIMKNNQISLSSTSEQETPDPQSVFPKVFF
ncbi:hypothetical protein BB561_003105 [Smittium simulii]|uniref:Mannosyltransferase n=1 Tax=Smittium simulii TaxID=133385 RepID=A0A2T9YMZ3_9FUNG|nr:hypothetical protein BB561_003105 [Smittium simulii]